ncbi:MAG: hypothetical protein Kow00129_05150 [Thermoleophilia bacterium]
MGGNRTGEGLPAYCAVCDLGQKCYEGDPGCRVSRRSLQEEVTSRYLSPEVLEMSRQSAYVEHLGYRIWDRAYETVQFARRMGYKHLGIAFCVTVRAEAEMYHRYLESQGFRVTSVMCKTGSIPKEELLGLEDSAKVRPGGFEAMCNPVAQAGVLDGAGVELAVVMGLCVGHDTVFIQHCRAPVTVLVAKDRAFDHKPIEAIRRRAAGDLPPEPPPRRTPEQIAAHVAERDGDAGTGTKGVDDIQVLGKDLEAPVSGEDAE